MSVAFIQGRRYNRPLDHEAPWGYYTLDGTVELGYGNTSYRWPPVTGGLAYNEPRTRVVRSKNKAVGFTGRYITFVALTPERKKISVGKWPFHIAAINF
jgi:hypothetical protein